MTLDAKLDLLLGEVRRVKALVKDGQVQRLAYTRQELAAACGVSPSSVDRASREQRDGDNVVIHGVRIQPSYLFGKPVYPVAEVERALRAHMVNPSASNSDQQAA